MTKKVLSLVFILSFFFNGIAQMSGVYSVPGSFTSLATAISSLNAVGITSGVTVNIAAGYTETVPTGGYTLTATGTSTSPIVFQKSGSGANPLILAYAGGTAVPSSAVQDGVWSFVGSDYITIDGLNISDPNLTNPATMEYGIGLFKASPYDGCRNNTIKNCVITLRRVNNEGSLSLAPEGSRGIQFMNSLISNQTSLVYLFSVLASNSDNKIFSNTIQNCNIAISMLGFSDASPYLMVDKNNDIGGTSALTGNTLINFGGGTSTQQNMAAGIKCYGQSSLNVGYNIINNNTSTGVDHPGLLWGFYNAQIEGGTGLAVHHNTLTLSSGSSSLQLSGIDNFSLSTVPGDDVTISNNVFANSTNTLMSSGEFYGIRNTAATGSLDISGNTFTNNVTSATTGDIWLITNTGSVSALTTIQNNTLSFGFNNPVIPYSGNLRSINQVNTALTSTLSISNNNFTAYNFSGLTASGNLYFIYTENTNFIFNLKNNTWTNLLLNHSGNHYLMLNYATTQNTLSVSGNSLVSSYNRIASCGTLQFYYSNIALPVTCTQFFSDNNFSNVTGLIPGNGSLYGLSTFNGLNPNARKIVFNNIVSNLNYAGMGEFRGIQMYGGGDGSSSSGSAVYNNTVMNVHFGGYMYGIYVDGPVSPNYPLNIYSNQVTNLSSNGPSVLVHGMLVGSYLGVINVFKNKIGGISTSGNLGGAAYGLLSWNAFDLKLYNNIIGHISAPNLVGEDIANGIYISGGTKFEAFNNTVYLNATSTSTNSGTNAFYTSTAPVVNLRNNIFINLSVPTGTGASAVYKRSSTSLSTYSTSSNNNLFYAGTPGASHLLFHDGTNAYQTLTSFQTAMGTRDAASISQPINFLSLSPTSPNYLHIQNTIASAAESAGVNISGISDDIDSQIRQGNIGYAGTGTAPDIGADEFNLNTTACSSAGSGSISISASTICPGTPVILNFSGIPQGTGFTYQWKVSATSAGSYSNVSGGSGGTSPDYTISALPSGTFYFSLVTTCTNGPVSYSGSPVMLVVNQSPTVSATINSTLVCPGASINIIGASTATNYQWYDPNNTISTQQNFSIAVASYSNQGIYTLFAPSALGCPASAAVVVSVSAITASLFSSEEIICGSSAATVAISSSGTSYTWSTGSNASTIIVNPTVTTVYSATVADGGNCIATASKTLNVITATISGTGITACPQAATTLSVNAFTPSSISWYSSPSSTNVIANGATYTINPTTNTALYAQAFSPAAGTLSANIGVLGGPAYKTNAFDVKATSNIQVTSFDVRIPVSVNDVIEIWYRPGSYVGYTSSSAGWTYAGTANVTGLGLYSLTPVSIPMNVNISAGQTYAFYIQNTTGYMYYALGGFNVVNVNDNYAINYTGDAGFGFTNTSSVGLGSRFIGQMHYTKPVCASALIPITVSISPQPTISLIASSTSVCASTNVTLTVSGAATYSWSSGQTTNPAIVQPPATTVYSVDGANTFGCVSTATIAINTSTLPNVQLSPTTSTVCAFTTLNLSGSGAITYTWNTGSTNSGINVAPAASTLYTLYGTGSNGCVGSMNASITVNPLPTILVSPPSTTICPNDGIVFTASGADSYTWLPTGNSSPVLTDNPVSSTIYTVTGMDNSTGCYTTQTANAVVITCTILTGLNKISESEETIKIIPNPSSGLVKVVFSSGGERKIELMSLQGVELKIFRTSSTTEPLDLTGIIKGIYFLRIESGSKASTHKIVIE